MTALPPPVQSVLELFQGPLASVRFADIDAAGLSKLAAEVEAAASDVQEHEGKLAELRQTLAQRQEALLSLAQQALAYARVYAESDEALLDAVNRITLPRPTKPRKSPAKGAAARSETSEASGSAGTEEDAASADPADVAPDANEGAEPSTPADAESALDAAAVDAGEPDAGKLDSGTAAPSGRSGSPGRGPRKGGRGAAQRAAN